MEREAERWKDEGLAARIPETPRDLIFLYRHREAWLSPFGLINSLFELTPGV